MPKKVNKEISQFFKIKEEFGGGVTSLEEIEKTLVWLFSKGLLTRQKEKNGKFSYKTNKKMSKEEALKIFREGR